MPLMKRMSKRAEKIAFSILGIPPNMRSKKNKQQQYISDMLMKQNTRRVR